MNAYLALADETRLALVYELDRVLDRENVIAAVAVAVIDHRRERRRLAGAGRPGHEHEALVEHREFFQHRRQRRADLLELLERHDVRRNLPEHRRHAVFLIEKIRAKPRHARNFVAEIDIPRFLVRLDFDFGGDFVKHLLEALVVQRRIIHAVQFAVDAQDGRVARREMEVRCLLLEHQVEERVDLGHS